jgi:hypothetical protein
VGTIYFEENDDTRSNTREYQWPAVKAGLESRGIPWVESRLTSGSTPLDRPDVRGAVVGISRWTVPNGSTYLPGSWVDSLTSYGAQLGDHAQAKATDFLRVGAGGSCGTVIEPYANPYRFTNASIHLFIADGSTLGEAFYKSVNSPILQMFFGDLLAQPYADVPVVQIVSGPAHEGVVSGASIPINVEASLNSPTLATGITRIELWIDGQLHETVPGASAEFVLDTTTLSDGRHELRAVAINNAAAESQGSTARTFVVDNAGRAVQFPGGDISIDGDQSVSLNASATPGSSGATVTRIEARNLGRVLGSVNAANGVISFDPTLSTSLMAYGANPVVPVAIFSDGQEVAGKPIVLTRNALHIEGLAPLPPVLRKRGIKAEYFLGRGGTTLAASDFSQPADIETEFTKLFINNPAKTNFDSIIESPALPHPTTEIDKLAARYTGRFVLTAEQAGEYAFNLFMTNDAAQLKVDGQVLMKYDSVQWGASNVYNYVKTTFLAEGEHDFELLVANVVNPADPDVDRERFDVALYARGPDAITRVFGETFAYHETPLIAGPARSDLRGKWSFEGTGLVFDDTSGNGNTGTPTATITPLSRVPGWLNKGMRFQSANQEYINVGTDASLDITNAITVSAWVKLNADKPNIGLIWCGDVVSSRYFLRIDYLGRVGLSLGTVNEGWHFVGSGKQHQWKDVWHHVAWTYDSATGTSKFYVDGVLDYVNSTASTGPIGQGALRRMWIGGGGDVSNFDGDMDEVRIYSVALDQQQVQSLLSDAYLQWLLDNELPLDGSGEGAATATPAQDGLPNLLKFATGMGSPSTPGMMPGEIDAASEDLLFTYDRNKDAAGEMAYAVTWSDTLAPDSWSTEGVTSGSVVDQGSTERVTAVVPRGPGPRRFIRLNVTKN